MAAPLDPRLIPALGELAKDDARAPTFAQRDRGDGSARGKPLALQLDGTALASFVA